MINRECGDCTLCCKLVPVKELDKPASTRCIHQRQIKGCLVYHTPKMPLSCHIWNCRWLVKNDTDDLARPDRSHYVIDIMPDFVIAVDDGKNIKIQVVQVWVDANYPDAWKDPRLKAYMMRRGEEGIATMIRYNSNDAFIIIPPKMNTGNEWIIRKGDMREKSELNKLLLEE
jgi:hypothetical protein